MARFIRKNRPLSIDMGSPTGKLIAAYQYSNVSSIDLSLIFPVKYSSVTVYLAGITVTTDNAELWARAGTGSPTVTYDSGNNYLDSTTTRDHMEPVSGGIGNAAGEHANIRTEVTGANNPSKSTSFSVSSSYISDNGSIRNASDSELYVPTTVVTGLQYYASSGNISGFVYVMSKNISGGS